MACLKWSHGAWYLHVYQPGGKRIYRRIGPDERKARAVLTTVNDAVAAARDLAGHSSIMVTDRYAHTDTSRLQEAVGRL